MLRAKEWWYFCHNSCQGSWLNLFLINSSQFSHGLAWIQRVKFYLWNDLLHLFLNLHKKERQKSQLYFSSAANIQSIQRVTRWMYNIIRLGRNLFQMLMFTIYNWYLEKYFECNSLYSFLLSTYGTYIFFKL